MFGLGRIANGRGATLEQLELKAEVIDEGDIGAEAHDLLPTHLLINRR